MQPLYSSSKSYLCCSVPGLAAELWTILTVLGWLGLALAVASMVILGQLDKTHGSGACCSCTCLRPTRLPTVGKAIDMEEAGGAASVLRSRQYLRDEEALLNYGDPVVEVRVNAGGEAGAARGSRGAAVDGGVRSWLELTDSRPPGPQEMSGVRQGGASTQSLPRVAH